MAAAAGEEQQTTERKRRTSRGGRSGKDRKMDRKRKEREKQECCVSSSQVIVADATGSSVRGGGSAAGYGNTEDGNAAAPESLATEATRAPLVPALLIPCKTSPMSPLFPCAQPHACTLPRVDPRDAFPGTLGEASAGDIAEPCVVPSAALRGALGDSAAVRATKDKSTVFRATVGESAMYWQYIA
jgi:hypothetical protein